MIWQADDDGVLTLPSGPRVRGRSLRRPPQQPPEWGLYLLGRRPNPPPWAHRWLRWRDFWLPSSTTDALDALTEARDRAGTQRVEIACGGGVGRTGTALAALAIIDGLNADEAVEWVRREYHPRAVETPWQRAWLRRRVASAG